MKIKLNIKKVRKEKGLSQKELAEILGVHQVNVSEYERGTQYPSLERLVQLAEALDLTLDELVEYKKAHEKYTNSLIK